MNYHDKLTAMRDFAVDNFDEGKDLADWLNLSTSDIIKGFPHVLVDAYERVFTPDLSELEELGTDEELKAWSAFDLDGGEIPTEGYYDEDEE